MSPSDSENASGEPARAFWRRAATFLWKHLSSLVIRWWKFLLFVMKRKWRLPVSVLVVTGCIIGSYTFISSLDGKSVLSSRVIHPPAILSILSSIFGICLGFAILDATTISWWRTLLRGTTAAKLDQIWDRGTSLWGLWQTGISPDPGSNPEACVLAAVAFIGYVTKFACGPLLQQALLVQSREKATNETMMMNIPPRIPDGWGGNIDYTKLGNASLSPSFISIIQQWHSNVPIMTHDAKNYTCPGTCRGNATGAGMEANCSSTTESLVFNDLYRNGTLAFTTHFSQFEDLLGVPTLRLVTKYVTSVNETCGATLTVDTCNIQAATIKYPVIIQNSTVSLNQSQLISPEVVTRLKAAGDSPAAKAGTPIGPLTILNGFGNAHFQSNATVTFNTTTQQYDMNPEGVLARLYLDTNWTHYRAVTNCNYQFLSPTDDILSALREVLFRTALAADNGTFSNFSVRQVAIEPVYHVQNKYLISAVITMSVALLVVLWPVFGLWRNPREGGGDLRSVTELEEDINLSPIKGAQVWHPRTPDVDTWMRGMIQYRRIEGASHWRMDDRGMPVPPPNHWVSFEFKEGQSIPGNITFRRTNESVPPAGGDSAGH
ncbi:hypothetical protein FGG08_001102 [Glutinoglossum americanum]|uniref:Uncharacterized protein n=1 Tax=Glutinoglossum americanum TaxID=1670608 RepID=A0A9P8IBM9_9PEZI|nr:hypothetical protein FGG08_001102 [Glutinoglossum americanum]